MAAMRRAIASLCVCWLAWCGAPRSNTVPLAFGMTPDEASAALGLPLVYHSGRPGSEIYHRRRPRRHSRLLSDRPRHRLAVSPRTADRLEEGLAVAAAGAILTGMAAPRIPLSVLDLSPVSAGSSGAVALRNSIDLAQFAERLGFNRYWVAEHHNLPSVASSAPEIMIGQIAAATTQIRVGSGGVMLPNHAPLMVAERFKVLEALFPGRIDLGLGRAPGTDPVTSYALRRRQTGGHRATISWSGSRS